MPHKVNSDLPNHNRCSVMRKSNRLVATLHLTELKKKRHNARGKTLVLCMICVLAHPMGGFLFFGNGN